MALRFMGHKAATYIRVLMYVCTHTSPHKACRLLQSVRGCGDLNTELSFPPMTYSSCSWAPAVGSSVTRSHLETQVPPERSPIALSMAMSVWSVGLADVVIAAHCCPVWSLGTSAVWLMQLRSCILILVHFSHMGLTAIVLGRVVLLHPWGHMTRCLPV
jgi:hypothetical protein